MEQVNLWWEKWILWQLVGKRVEAFAMATGWQGPMPKSMLETFFEIDNVYSKMEAQKIEEEIKKNKRK